MSDEYLLTVVEVKTELGVSTGCVRRWIREGRFSVVWVGPRSLRIPRAEVDRLRAAGRVSARPAETPIVKNLNERGC